MPLYSVSKFIASTNSSFTLSNDSNTITINFINDIDMLLKQLNSNSLSLLFENITGNDGLPVIDIYLNLEDQNKPTNSNYVGSMALYGLSESSVQFDKHSAAGQNRVFDVSEAFNKVRSQPNWSNKQFVISLIPNRQLSGKETLTIGRTTLYYHEN